MTLAVCSQPSAIEMPGTAVSMALVVAAVLGAGLGVEGLELARAAGHPEQDAGHLPLPQLVGLQDHQVGEADRDGPEARQPGRAPAQRPKEAAPAHHPVAAHPHLDDARFRSAWSCPGVTRFDLAFLPIGWLSAREMNSVELMRAQ